MTTAASYFDRKPSSNIRPGLSHLQPDPSSPHTPQRTFSSTFSSPSISYRNEDDALIFDFGARHFSAGFAGESTPRCTLSFGPEKSRRVGDYRQWLPGYRKLIRRQSEDDWGKEHELWRMDLREVDMGLVEDKIERVIREACNKYLLLDVKTRRILLILPSVLPHQLLSGILSTIFVNFQHPSITLFSTPTVHTVAAGCRSSLVVDIGWSETTVTAIYEYREVYQSRTTRAMKRVTIEMVKMLQTHAAQSPPPDRQSTPKESDAWLEADFDIVEDITARISWCPTLEDSQRTPTLTPQSTTHPSNPPISLPSPFPHPPSTLSLPFTSLSHPTESALLAPSTPHHTHDDHEQPLPTLIYTALLSLPPDIRAVCMSHLILTGGGASIPGLKARLLDELTTTIRERGGWDRVTGQAAEERKRRLSEIDHNRNLKPAAGLSTVAKEDAGGKQAVPASRQEQVPDPVEEKLRAAAMKGTKPVLGGVVRGVESLGAWAGGSLVAALRIRGVVEVEREAFLAGGLGGGKGGGGGGGGGARGGRGEAEGAKAGWTMGGWA